ncbi:hypothetical protein L21SP2_1107 [Salinispira pacifica]|uniref:Uncharacterized protein n=1 Tax=Salinispira pacifica TaxID=1307761 RepID=V5WFE4_9SPIO|nr:hypothetical protein L21SP2_1107 [Salinispira pacifica]
MGCFVSAMGIRYQVERTIGYRDQRFSFIPGKPDTAAGSRVQREGYELRG